MRRLPVAILVLLLAACGQSSPPPAPSESAAPPEQPMRVEQPRPAPPVGVGTGAASQSAPPIASPSGPGADYEPYSAAPAGRGPASMGAPMLAEPTAPTAPPVVYHVYQRIAAYGSELSGYGMYTYVLFPRKAPTGSALAERYRQLTAAIEKTTLTPAEAQAAGFLPAEGNLFCLPDGNGSARLVLSLRLLNHLRQASAAARALLPIDRPGPFLISLPVPVRQISGEVPMLVADLSHAHVDAFPEIVVTYKQRLRGGGIDKTASFRSLRLTLLSLLLVANDDLSLVKVALAAWPVGGS
jgi:predicted small lipoprotein YifL